MLKREGLDSEKFKTNQSKQVNFKDQRDAWKERVEVNRGRLEFQERMRNEGQVEKFRQREEDALKRKERFLQMKSRAVANRRRSLL